MIGLSLDVTDKEESKYQNRITYEKTHAINFTDDRYSDCFFRHSIIPAQSPHECLQNYSRQRFWINPSLLDMAS